MKKNINKILIWVSSFLFLLLVSVNTSIAELTLDANNGLYSSIEHIGEKNYFPNGYPTHVFNKYLDSIELCRAFLQLKDNDLYMKKQYLYSLGNNIEKIDLGDECSGNLYTDERNFIGVNLLYSKSNNYVNNALKLSWEEYGIRQMHYSLEYKNEKYFPQKGDLMQIRVYVNDNGYINATNDLSNIRVFVKIEDNNIIARVGTDTIFSVATSKVSLDSSFPLELEFAEFKDYPSYLFKDGVSLYQMANYITYKELVNTPKIVRNLKSNEYSISSNKKEFTLIQDQEIEFFPYTITLDLVVKNKN